MQLTARNPPAGSPDRPPSCLVHTDGRSDLRLYSLLWHALLPTQPELLCSHTHAGRPSGGYDFASRLAEAGGGAGLSTLARAGSLDRGADRSLDRRPAAFSTWLPGDSRGERRRKTNVAGKGNASAQRRGPCFGDASCRTLPLALSRLIWCPLGSETVPAQAARLLPDASFLFLRSSRAQPGSAGRGAAAAAAATSSSGAGARPGCASAAAGRRPRGDQFCRHVALVSLQR